MGLALSIVFPALPVLVSYNRTKGASPLAVPVNPWAMVVPVKKVNKVLWLKKASEQRISDRELGYDLPDSLACPRYFSFRRLGNSQPYRWVPGEGGNLRAFREQGFKAELRTRTSRKPSSSFSQGLTDHRW